MLRATRTKQAGITLVGLVIILFLLALAVAFGFKITPAWVEYFGVKKAVSSMAANGDLTKTPPEIRNAFDRHAEVGYIAAITGKDLELTKTGNGYDVSFSYRKEVPVVANMSVVFDFTGNAGKGGGGGKRRVE